MKDGKVYFTIRMTTVVDGAGQHDAILVEHSNHFEGDFVTDGVELEIGTCSDKRQMRGWEQAVNNLGIADLFNLLDEFNSFVLA